MISPGKVSKFLSMILLLTADTAVKNSLLKITYSTTSREHLSPAPLKGDIV